MISNSGEATWKFHNSLPFLFEKVIFILKNLDLTDICIHVLFGIHIELLPQFPLKILAMSLIYRLYLMFI